MKITRLLSASPILLMLLLAIPRGESGLDDTSHLSETNSTEILNSQLIPVAISSVCIDPNCETASIELTGFIGLPCPCISGLTDDMSIVIRFPLLNGNPIDINVMIETDCQSTATFDIDLPPGIDCDGDIQIISLIQDPDDSDGNGSCPQPVEASSSFVSIAINPVASANGPMGPFCLDDGQIVLTGSPSPDPWQTGFWTGAGVADVSVLDSLGTFNPLAAGVGTHAVVYEFTDNTGCSGTDTLFLIVNDSPLSNAGDDFDLCSDDTEQIHAAVAGGIMPYIYTWTAGNGTFVDAGVEDPLYMNTIPGPDTVVISVQDQNGCITTDTLIVTVIEAPDVNIGNDTTICSNNDYTFNTVITGGSAPFSYSWSATSGTFDDESIANATYTNDTPGSYDVTLTVADSSGCIVASTVSLLVIDAVDVSLGWNKVMCADDDYQFEPEIGGGQMPYTYSWIATGGSFSDSAIANPVYFNDIPGSYIVTLAVGGGNGCVTEEEVIVTVLDSIVIDLPETLMVCEFSETLIDAGVSGGTLPYIYNWTNTGGSFVDKAVEDPIYQSIVPGAYLVHLEVTDAFGCSSTKGIVILVGAQFELDAGADLVKCSNSDLELDADITGGEAPFQYLWEAEEGTFVDSSLLEAIYLNSEVGTYELILTVTDTFGCVQMDTILVEVTDPPIVSAGIDRTICNEEPIVMNPTIVGGAGPLSYLWTSNGGGFSDISVPNPNYTSNISGIFTLILTVTDANGCTNFDSMTVVVNQDPFFQNCPDTLVFGNDEDQCGAFANWPAPVGLDHCNLNVTISQTFGPQSGSFLLIDSLYTVTYIVEAESGNSSECSFVVRIEDTQCPEFITALPDDLFLECNDVPTPFLVVPAWHTKDNCTDAENVQVIFEEDTTLFECANSFIIKRRWTLIDSADNECFYTQKITVKDSVAPEFMVPADDSVSCDDLASVDTIVTDLSDNCTADSLLTISFMDISTQSADNSTCEFYTYQIQRVYTVEDECMNSSEQTQIIEVTDDVLPMAICQDITIYVDANGNATASAEAANNGSFDACAPDSVLSLSLSQDMFTCENLGDNEVLLFVEDPCGNVGACVTTITVVDTIAPTVICPGNTTISMDPGACEEIVHFSPTIISNDCAAYWYSEPASGSAFEIGVHAITIFAIDSSGNSSSCETNLTILEYPGPISDISCNNQVNLSLNVDCEAEITADLILEGGPYGCYDDYIVTVYDSLEIDTISTSPFVNIDHIGQTFVVTVYDPETGNSCWGYVYVEHKINPEIICPADTIIPCNHSWDPALLGYPLVLSCEASVTIDYNDVVTDNGACGEPRREIIRTWTVEDESGNETTCIQTILIDAFDLEQVAFPIDLALYNQNALECFDVLNNPDLVNPESAGVPSIMGLPLDPDEQTLCDFTLSFWDKEQPGCGNSYSISREWSILDVCREVEEGVNPRKHIQIIHVVDISPPVVLGPDDVTLSTNVNDCVTQWSIPAPIVEDCSAIDYFVTSTGGYIVDFDPGFVIFNLEEGETVLTYAIEDYCGNIVEHQITITVEDNVPPTPVCDEFTVVGITSTGTAHVFAESFDDGSHDNCGPVFVKVIKEEELCGTNEGVDAVFNDCLTCDGINGDDDAVIFGNQSWFDDYAVFCCDEVGLEKVIVLRVFDKDPGEGPVAPARMRQGGDLYGHYNDCQIFADIQDQLPPVMACPPNITVSCDYVYDPELLSDLSDRTFGSMVNDIADREEVQVLGHGHPLFDDDHIWGEDGFAIDNCEVDINVDVSQSIECNQGVITRVFTATDPSGNASTCVQRIFFESFDPFGEDDIVWPADIEVTDLCAEDVEENLGLTGEPTYGADVCSNVLISSEDEFFYQDQDACLKILRTWKLLDWCQYDENTGEGIFYHTQVIKISNATAPEMSNCEDVSLCDSAATGCLTFVELIAIATDDCTDSTAILFTWDIDLFHEDDNNPDDFDSDIETPNARGTVGDGANDASGNYPFGLHKVRWTIEDGCGNESICEYFLDLQDCKKPSPKCYSGIVTVVMEGIGEVDVWAAELDAGSDDNCGDVVLSFSEDTSNTVATFTCDDLGSQTVELWVTDAYGNQAFCETYLIIQDNNDVCGNNIGMILGQVYNPEDEMLENAQITIEETGGGMNEQDMSSNNGEYAFFEVPFFTDYKITSYKNDDVDNGISTADMVRIQKHLLGLQEFTTPYEYIAADVNASEGVSALDIIVLRQLLLGLIDEFPNNTSWKFLDAEADIPNIHNPWPLDEEIDILDFESPVMNQMNFMAVKVGDLNGSAQLNGLLGVQDRNYTQDINLTYTEMTYVAGETLEFSLSAEYDLNIDGLQLELVLPDGLSITDVKSELMDIEEGIHYRIIDNSLRLTWSRGHGLDVSSDQKLFTLVLSSDRSGSLRQNEISLDQSFAAELYSESSLYSIHLVGVKKAEVLAQATLHQNVPNPFYSETVIQLDIPELHTAELNLYSADGDFLFTLGETFTEGTHRVQLNSADFRSGGVYLYEIVVKDASGEVSSSETKKLLLLD